MKASVQSIISMGLLFVLGGCSSDTKQTTSSDVSQVGDMIFTNMQLKWSCKMLAHDFDKYYPRYNRMLDNLKDRGCIPANTEVANFNGELDIQNTTIPAAPAYDLKKKDACLNDTKYAADLAGHLNNIKNIWSGKCDRSVTKKEKEYIYDTPACMSYCYPYLTGCYTCSPESSNFADGGKGTITCASSFDAKNAVLDYCKIHKLESCRPVCRFTPGNTAQLQYLGSGISGTTISDSFSNTSTYSGAVNINAGLSAIFVSGGLSKTITGTFEFTNSISIDSSATHLYQMVKYDLNDEKTWRKEYTQNTTYTCSISTAKIKDLSASANISLGFSQEWHGIGGSFGIDFSASAGHSTSAGQAFSRINIDADGKTVAEVKAECADWSKRTLATYAVAKPVMQTPFVLKSDDIICRYADGDTRPLSEVSFVFSDDDSGVITYKSKGFLGVKKAKAYTLASGMEQFKLPILNATDKVYPISPVAKKEIIVKAMNILIAKESAKTEKEKWRLESCQ